MVSVSIGCSLLTDVQRYVGREMCVRNRRELVTGVMTLGFHGLGIMMLMARRGSRSGDLTCEVFEMLRFNALSAVQHEYALLETQPGVFSWSKCLQEH